jgi:hypothetical protein
MLQTIGAGDLLDQCRKNQRIGFREELLPLFSESVHPGWLSTRVPLNTYLLDDPIPS